jgi:hypothetical protein
MSLRNRVIRLAHANPGPLQDALLPLLKVADNPLARSVIADLYRSLERGGLDGDKAYPKMAAVLKQIDYVLDFYKLKLRLTPKIRASLKMPSGDERVSVLNAAGESTGHILNLNWNTVDGALYMTVGN